MTVVRAARRHYGLRIEIVDLGAWAERGLNAEYDGRGPTIRVNARRMDALHGSARRRFFVRAVAHELYHHLEAIGAVARMRPRAERECAADAFARALVP
ncbi:MAG TPA: hypothetical protein VMV82_05410 [Candidatus Dormibacteraeota bacterium]|nr:hypothetical protein [Candidatus Dormibacteraeota bacterium]